MTEPIDPALLGPEAPTTKSLTVFISPSPRAPADLTIRLLVPLDPSQPDEKAAFEQLAEDGTLDVQYRVNLDLTTARNALSDAIAKMYRNPAHAAIKAQPLAPVTDIVLRMAMTKVAVQGSSVYRRLFPFKQFDGQSEVDFPMIARALKSAFSRPQRIVVESPVSLFPWTFLYDDIAVREDDQQSLKVERFWGFSHQIQERIEGVSKQKSLPKEARILAAIAPDVDPEAQSHKNGPLGTVGAGRVMWTTSAADLEAALADCDADCIYFYGHAAQDDPPLPTTSWIKLAGTQVTVENLQRAEAPKLKKKTVLVFLNGCETAPLNVWSADSIVGHFCLSTNYHVCCVATFAEVPIAFGPAFAAQFWTAFLEERTLGEALLYARKKMLKDYNNPLGLLYAVYGRVETRLG